MSRVAAGRPLICLVTDRQALDASWGDDPCDRLVRQVAAAAYAGVDLIQIRERDLPGAALLRLVERCLEAAAGSARQILVNDRVDVAMAAGAAGVHLRADSYPAGRVRAVCPRRFLVGRSLHTVREVAAAGPVDYLIFGTVFPTRSKPPGGAAAGLEGLAAVAAASPVPVLAIGGVTIERAAEIAAAGAAGIAAIGLFAFPVPGGGDGRAEMARRVAAIRRRFS